MYITRSRVRQIIACHPTTKTVYDDDDDESTTNNAVQKRRKSLPAGFAPVRRTDGPFNISLQIRATPRPRKSLFRRVTRAAVAFIGEILVVKYFSLLEGTRTPVSFVYRHPSAHTHTRPRVYTYIIVCNTTIWYEFGGEKKKKTTTTGPYEIFMKPAIVFGRRRSTAVRVRKFNLKPCDPVPRPCDVPAASAVLGLRRIDNDTAFAVRKTQLTHSTPRAQHNGLTPVPRGRGGGDGRIIGKVGETF